jgi:hypothetical protein
MTIIVYLQYRYDHVLHGQTSWQLVTVTYMRRDLHLLFSRLLQLSVDVIQSSETKRTCTGPAYSGLEFMSELHVGPPLVFSALSGCLYIRHLHILVDTVVVPSPLLRVFVKLNSSVWPPREPVNRVYTLAVSSASEIICHFRW